LRRVYNYLGLAIILLYFIKSNVRGRYPRSCTFWQSHSNNVLKKKQRKRSIFVLCNFPLFFSPALLNFSTYTVCIEARIFSLAPQSPRTARIRWNKFDSNSLAANKLLTRIKVDPINANYRGKRQFLKEKKGEKNFPPAKLYPAGLRAACPLNRINARLPN